MSPQSHFGRRAFFAAGAAASVSGALRLQPAMAAYPERPVTLLVCFPPGGATDVLARLLGPPLSEALGRPVVIENRAGAGGNIGMGAVARAQADGYTLLVTSSVFVVNPSLYRSVPYDPIRDFQPISTLGASPNVIAVLPSSGIDSLQDLIAQAKAHPDRFNYASPGIGTTPHLAGELLKLRTSIGMQHVPFSGAGPATQALLAGAVHVISAAQGSIAPQLKSGAFRALAQTGSARALDLPDTPTLQDLGIRDANSETFLALFAPAGTASVIVDKLAAEVVSILKRPDTQERYRQAGALAIADGPEGLKARVAREVPMWREVIREARIAVE
ncbi:tripartite tricarboxylate transporter substrate binding protein [Belnapia sp. T6]|uniref:Tripartite tricarboxylate transporter substrate binding protein n=1 Tax=Belnapia mucosa TaxID=2804532 RepID=A0ABS1VGQ3_9PROT|nr:tripartite tricarboxylate transporter substrate binding protein [Belnapia mucosa]MBL6459608.1 tripartite tricarboxylate transporter substrate binding protein [Belnapia mucosa]